MTNGSLPNFLIIGAQKSGTSWLSQLLATHPEVFMAKKEIHFFDKAYNYSKGADWYKKHFKETGKAKAIGEKTPDYLWANGIGVEGHLPKVHLNIQQHLPEARLILILRNPVDRAVSAVRHIIRSRRISPHYKIDNLLIGKAAAKIKGHGVLEYGFYNKQIQAYLELFDRKKLLILIFEEAMADKSACLKSVCNFLEIDLDYKFSSVEKIINTHKISKSGYFFNYYFPEFYFRVYRRIERFFTFQEPFIPEAVTLEKLYEIYKEPNQQLFQLLGRKVDAWINPTLKKKKAE